MTQPKKYQEEIKLTLPFKKEEVMETSIDFGIASRVAENFMIVHESTGIVRCTFISSDTEISISTSNERIKKALNRFLQKMHPANKIPRPKTE